MVVPFHPSLPSALYKPLEAPALYAIDHPEAGLGATSGISMAEISVDTVWQAVSAAMRGEVSTLPGMSSPGIDADVEIGAGHHRDGFPKSEFTRVAF